MAYNQNPQNQGRSNSSDTVPARAPNRAAAPAQTGGGFRKTASSPDGEKKVQNRLFRAFKNKGAGYSITLKEDITIPAGTKIGVFQDTVEGKDGTKYDVMNITKLPQKVLA